MKLAIKLVALSALLAGGNVFTALGACSSATLRGDYGFTITGQILQNPLPENIGPVAGVALTTFDGAGSLTQLDHVVHNGNVPQGWRSATGSYTLAANCTGTMTLVFSDGTPTMNLHIVVSNFGTQVRAVVDGPVAITSLGIRVGWGFF